MTWSVAVRLSVFSLSGLVLFSAHPAAGATRNRPVPRATARPVATATPEPTPIRAEGQLIDRYSGAPASGVTLRLKASSGGQEIEATAGADGRVVFDSLSAGSHMASMVTGASYELLDDPNGPGLLHLTVPPADLGRIGVPATAWAESTLAPLCQKARAAAQAPATSVVVFEPSDGGWKLFPRKQSTIEKAWKHPWKAAVCLQTDYKTVGRYVTTTGMGSGTAERQTVRARVIRLDNGKEYKTKMSADPPPQTSSTYGGFGDTSADLQRWIDGLPD